MLPACQESEDLPGFFIDVTGVSPSQREQQPKTAQAIPATLTRSDAEPRAIVPSDGPGGNPEGWEPPPICYDYPSKRIRPEAKLAQDGETDFSFSNLTKYYSSLPGDACHQQRMAEARRYYGGASGSASATQTDDGYLTKLGAKRVCIVCSGKSTKRAHALS
jgi:hypothetical protein